MTKLTPRRILYVDLTKRKTYIRTWEAPEQRLYLGGNGLGAKILYEEVPPRTDPLAVENVLVFAVGPLTGTVFTSTAMTAVVTKSPLTGLFLDSYFGGHFGVELRSAGYEALVIKGAAAEPVYLDIYNNEVVIKDAAPLWGKDTFTTQEEIKKLTGTREVEVACIGPAGENLVRFASIISGTRAAGRGGVGAVMGAKKLKAIAVRGTGTIVVPDPAGLIEYTRKTNEKLKKHPGAGKAFPTYGSTASPATYSAMGIFGTRNWQTETLTGAEMISGEYNARRGLLVRSRACSACIIRSSKVWCTGPGPYGGCVSEGPEYETIFSLGGLCANLNFDAIVKGDRLCDEYGLDTITTGASIAFAMECFEAGLLIPAETGGLALRFGNHEAMIKLIHLIARREGLGDLLAEGTRRAAQKIGCGAEKFTLHVKGYEFPGHSARAHKGMAVGYATSNRGASHQDTRVTPERSGKFDPQAVAGKGKLAKDTQDMTTIGDSLIVCRRATETAFGFFLNENFLTFVNLATGHKYSLQELREVAERIYALEKMFNVREGVSRADDTLPPRFLQEPIPEGPCRGQYVTPEELEQMLDEYYEARGWERSTSHPTAATLDRLGLGHLSVDLPGTGQK